MENKTMTIKEANRLSMMKQVDKKILSLRRTAEEIGISIRQSMRIRKRYLAEGIKGIIYKHRGKTSPNRIQPKVKEAVMNILEEINIMDLAQLLHKKN